LIGRFVEVAFRRFGRLHKNSNPVEKKRQQIQPRTGNEDSNTCQGRIWLLANHGLINFYRSCGIIALPMVTNKADASRSAKAKTRSFFLIVSYHTAE
jgi:hypothetical protein